MKTASLTGMGSRSCEGLPVIWTRKVEFFFLERTQSWSGEVTEFWLRPFFFGDHLILAEASNWCKTDENLSQVRLLLFSPLKKAPSPFAKSWLRAWHV